MNRLFGFFLLLAIVGASSDAYGQGGFGEADADGDKKVTVSELKTYVSGKLSDFDRFDELLVELDKDENGSISEDEFASRMEAVQAIMERPRPEKKMEKPKKEEREIEEFTDRYERMVAKRKPLVGDEVPNISAFDEEGKPFEFDSTRGKYTVITFGCLT